MSATAIVDILSRETGRFGNTIYNRVFDRSPWIKLVKRDTWNDEFGETISNLTYERSAPTDAEPTWSAYPVQDGQEGGSCLPDATKINVASTVRSFSLKRRVLEGPDFCVENIRSSFQLRSQLEKIMPILEEYTMLEWENRYRHDFFTYCNRKVVVKSSSLVDTNTMAAAYPAHQAGSRLTQGVLDTYKLKLMRDGAGAHALGRENNMPVFTLICSAETSDSIIRDNAENRSDLRWAKPNELLAPFGVERSYRGFYHLVDPYPRRFSESGGVYTEIAPFTTESTTKGNRAIVNSSWESATYEESFIFSPSVFTSRIPKPISAPASNFKFDPQNYLGHWKLMNIIDRQNNPDGTIIYHRGILAEAPEPIHPEHGVAFIHKRCDPSIGYVTACS